MWPGDNDVCEGGAAAAAVGGKRIRRSGGHHLAGINTWLSHEEGRAVIFLFYFFFPPQTNFLPPCHSQVWGRCDPQEPSTVKEVNAAMGPRHPLGGLTAFLLYIYIYFFLIL